MRIVPRQALTKPDFGASGMKKAPVPELERLSTDTYTASSVEHLHRYAMAADLCRGKDVLDIASGEGYGSNLLANLSNSVTGVDISTDVIEHASAKYVRPNLRFLQGSADAIPLPTGSVDAVVSFETLEHHDKHEEMLREIKRVLRGNGMMIISTPDKLSYSDIPQYKNEYHVKELYLDEFTALVQRFFKRHRLLFQGLLYGTFITPERDWTGFAYYRGDFEACEAVQYVSRHDYNIAIASDGELPEIGVSFFDGNQVLRDFKRLVAEERRHASNLEYRLHSLEKVLRDVEHSLAYRLGRSLSWPVRLLRSR
jgi:2-polyprenyl-3-methyl-5-hydroxy-6-metoxy-1,4-benzoquinol methylase